MRMQKGLNALEETKKKKAELKTMSPRNEGPIDPIAKEHIEGWTKSLEQLENEQTKKAPGTQHDKLVEQVMAMAAEIRAEDAEKEREQKYSDETIRQSEAITAKLTKELKHQKTRERFESAAQDLEADLADTIHETYVAPAPVKEKPYVENVYQSEPPPIPARADKAHFPVPPVAMEPRPKRIPIFKRLWKAFLNPYAVETAPFKNVPKPPNPNHRWDQTPKRDE
ncbi:MAG: hypothetical protein KGH79_02325 [Patescibacteria group bacterium]|nr:hypothetical protein [Patescibacteria group bacterium]